MGGGGEDSPQFCGNENIFGLYTVQMFHKNADYSPEERRNSDFVCPTLPLHYPLHSYDAAFIEVGAVPSSFCLSHGASSPLFPLVKKIIIITCKFISVEIWKNAIRKKKHNPPNIQHTRTPVLPPPQKKLFPLVHTFFQGHLGGFS